MDTSTGRQNHDTADNDTPIGLNDALREQQAIAAAQLVGEEMRREDRKRAMKLARRFVPLVAVFAVVLLLILFAYYRMAADDFNPLPWVLGIAVFAAAAAVLGYLGYVESNREDDD